MAKSLLARALLRNSINKLIAPDSTDDQLAALTQTSHEGC